MKRSYPIAVILFVLCFSMAEAQWIKQGRGLPVSWTAWAIDACDKSNAIVSLNVPNKKNNVSSLFKTIDAGEHWLPCALPDSQWNSVIDVSIIDSNHIWIAADYGKIYVSTNSGKNWIEQFSDTTKTKSLNYIKMFDLQHGVAMGDATGPNFNDGPAIFLRTVDGGAHWISVNKTAFGGWSGDMWRRIDFVNFNVGYFFESGMNPQKIYKTIDGGSSWTETAYPIAGLQVLKFYDEQIGLTIDGQFFLRRTDDGGMTWNFLYQSIPAWGNDIEFIPSDPSKIWMADLKGLYFSSDTGSTWTPQLQATGRDIVFVDKQNGWFLADGELYHTTNNGGLTGIEDDTFLAPSDFQLRQNYPNPFRSTTTIPFSLSSSSYINIILYNLIGQEVRSVTSEFFAAGNHTITFDESILPEGTYFYRLRAGKSILTKSLRIIK